MKYGMEDLAGVIVLMGLSLILGVVIAATSVQNSWRLDAAETECAQFNSLHGQFEWIKEEE